MKEARRKARWFGRAKHLTARKRVMEVVWDTLYRGGWAARLAAALGYQGPVTLDDCAIELAVDADVPAMRVAFASDLHAGPATDPRLLERAAELLSGSRPDLLLLGGDYVSFHARHVDRLVPLLRGIDAPAGKFAVLGNHDLIGDEEYIVARLADAGVRVLVNDSVRLPAPFDAVTVSGQDNFQEGAPDPASAFEGTGPVRILVSHSPDGVGLALAQPFDVAFCGHTHGGQFWTPAGRSVLGFKSPLTQKYVRAGLVTLDDGRPMLVSRGIGCGNLPLRRGADPQVHSCLLRFVRRAPGV